MNTTTNTRCPKCGSARIEYRREDAGFRKTSTGSRREHRTIGFCKTCGKTWVTAGPSLPFSSAIGTTLFKIFAIFSLIMLVIMFIEGRVYSFHKATKKVNYELTESNAVFVNNPSEDYVVSSLKKVDGIIEIKCASQDNDMNDLLNSDSGATSVVVFSYILVNQDEVEGDNLIDKGTNSGGCIEVFQDEKNAIAREKHLSIFGFSGSHVRLGTVIVRTSSHLSYKEQDELEERICKSLLGNPE